MSEMISSMSGFEQVVFIIACISSLLFLIKAVMMIFGIGGDDIDVPDDVDVPDGGTADVPAEIDVAGLEFFTLHGILAFLCIGSWTTFFAFGQTGSYLLSVLLGLVAGGLMMVACAFMVRALMRLQQSGNVDTVKAIGKIGEVYLRIPPMGEGKGKVNVELGGKECEYEAVSLDKAEIPYGTKVRVVDLQDDDIMVVQRESEELE